MGTIGDLAVVGVVGYIGLKVLGGNWSQSKIEDPKDKEANLTLPNNLVITPDPLPDTPTELIRTEPLKIQDRTYLYEWGVDLDSEKDTATIKKELEVPYNSKTVIEQINTNDQDRIIVKEETKAYSTKVDSSDNPIDLGLENLGNTLKSVGVLEDDWEYSGINVKNFVKWLGF